MDEEIRKRHPSFGQLQISRVTSSRGKPLYGSSLKHSNTITISIHESEHVRHLNGNNYFPFREIIEVEMSALQFAEAITNLNCGSGTPVTITRREMKRIEDCPSFNEREIFNAEFKNDIDGILKMASELAKEAHDLCNQKTVTKGNLNALKEKLEALQRDLNSNLQFVDKCFHESVEKSISAAKMEVEEFVNQTIRSAGLQAIQEKYIAPQIEGRVENGTAEDHRGRKER